MWLWRFHNNQDGDGSGGLIILTIMTLVGMFVIVFAGRLALTASAVTASAEDGARAGTLQQTVASAEGIAQSTTRNSISSMVPCEGLEIGVDAPADGDDPAALDRGGWVQVTVNCNVAVSDLSFASFLPGSLTFSHTARERVDIFRGV